jgi:gluconokinase
MTHSLARVLAVDIGTSSVRAMVFDATGKISARARICYGTVRPAPYFEEQDPDLVRDEVFRAIALCLAEPGADPGSIDAIAFSSQFYSLIAVDAEDRPLTWNILWSDGRAERQAAALKAAHGPLGLYSRTGCQMNSIYPLAKIVWLREVMPDLFARAARFVSIKEYVTRPLIDAWAVDHSMASTTGLFDIRTHDWDTAALSAAGIERAQLSRPVSGLAAFPLCAGSPLRDCGLRNDVKVFLGAGDGPLANLGSGASAIGAVNIDLGTSGAARCIVDAATTDADANLWCFCLTDRLWAYGGIVTNVGNAYQWLASHFGSAAGVSDDEAFAAMDRHAAAVAPGSDGVYMLPYLRKARAPHWDGRLKATIYGLTADHGVGHMARALLEAVAYDLRTIIAIMARRVTIHSPIVLTGGLSRSPIMGQLLADVLRLPVETPASGEGSIAGAAILALAGLGAVDRFAFAGGTPRGRLFEPAAAAADRYDRGYRGYTRLVETIRTLELEETGS